MELLLLADAARHNGAARVVAVVPYFGYARQDHDDGRPLAAGLVPRMMELAGIDHVITIDLHSRSTEMAFRIPVRHLSAVPLLATRLRDVLPPQPVLVAPDLGAAKLVDRYAQILELPVAFVRKQRTSGTDVEVLGITGDVLGRSPVIVDDMISTAGTIVAAATACLEAGASGRPVFAVTHGLLVGPAIERLSQLGVQSVFVSDSVSLPATPPHWLERVQLGELLATEMRALPKDRSSTAVARLTDTI